MGALGRDEREEKSDAPEIHGESEDAFNQYPNPTQVIHASDHAQLNITQNNISNNISNIIAFHPDTGDSKKLRVFSLYIKTDEEQVKSAEGRCCDYIEFVNGYEELPMHNGKLETLKTYDYVIAFISVKSLKDFNFLCRILDHFKYKKNKNRYIPVIMDEDLYNPKKRAELRLYWRNEIDTYKNEFLDGSFSEMLIRDLKRMQDILNILDDFILYAVNKDKFLSMDISDKIRKMVERRE